MFEPNKYKKVTIPECLILSFRHAHDSYMYNSYNNYGLVVSYITSSKVGQGMILAWCTVMIFTLSNFMNINFIKVFI